VFVEIILAAAISASPSPAPSVSRLHTSLYIRTYDASLILASALPGGTKQTDIVGTNLFALLHGDYDLGTHGWSAGATYYYVTPSALVQDTHTATWMESYVAYKSDHWSAKLGNQFFKSPWADTHGVLGLSPTAYQGVDASDSTGTWTFELADMSRFESRADHAFERTTLLSNAPMSGFLYGRASFTSSRAPYSLNAYAYTIGNTATLLWASGSMTLNATPWAPYVNVQGGVENNAGASLLGRIHSSIVGAQFGANPWPSLNLSVGFNAIPWRRDTIALPPGESCDAGAAQPTYQLSSQTAVSYFLPQGVAQCAPAANGLTNVYYGGWASPYSDSYATDPLYTTGFAEGNPDRHSPGTSSIIEGVYTSNNKRLTYLGTYTWHNYSNPTASERTTEWGNLATYRFNRVGDSAYKGLMLRYYYVVQRKTNVAYPNGATYLGSIPLISYNRIQLEYSL
jgi:hypothetical protein